MKQSIAALLLLLISTHSSAESVSLDSINYVYELNSQHSFDFAGGASHHCGSNQYRVKSTSSESIARKFSIVLAAFIAEKRIIVNAGDCEGDRRIVGWVRIQKN